MNNWKLDQYKSQKFWKNDLRLRSILAKLYSCHSNQRKVDKNLKKRGNAFSIFIFASVPVSLKEKFSFRFSFLFLPKLCFRSYLLFSLL